MSIKFDNNASGTLSVECAGATPGPEDTAIVLQAGEGALFPSVTTASGNFFYCTLEDISGNIEIVKCTNLATDTLTITRAQENTSSITFTTGSKVELRTTAATFDEFIQRTGGVMTGTLDMNGEGITDPVITSTGSGEIKGVPIRGADGGTGNQLLVPTASGPPSIGGNTILHTGNDTAYVQTTRTLTGGEGIAAIGDLSTDRTIDLDITELTSISGSAVGPNDLSVIYDDSAAVHKTISYQQAGIPIINVSTQTVVPNDSQMNSMFLCTHSADAIDFDLNLTVGEKGNFIVIQQSDVTHQVTIAGTATVNSAFAGPTTRTQYSIAVAVCTATNVWTVYGDLI